LVSAAGHVRALSSHRATLAALQEEAQRLSAQNAATNIDDDRDELRRQTRQFTDEVPLSSDLSSMLERLGQELDQGVALEREISTRPVVEGKDLAQIPVVVKFRGSFDQAFAVLRHIESSPRMTRLDRMLLEQPAGEGDRALKVEVEFSTFARVGKEAASWAAAE
jgi:Tfp pilus assembly protein PilO